MSTVTARSQLKRLLAGALMLLLALPGAANSFTLDQLLDMPIEQLLQLEITSRHVPANGLRAVEHRDAT